MKHSINSLKIIIYLIFISINVFGQNNMVKSLKDFSDKEIKEDYNIFRNALEEFHPGLYTNTSKDTFDLYFERSYNSIHKEMNILHFYQLLCPIISKIGCEHTRIEFPKDFKDKREQESKFLPFSIAVIDSTAFITSNNSFDSLIKPGAEILSINSVPIRTIVQKVFSSMGFTDGYNMTGKYRILSVAFPVFYYNLIEQPDSFKLEILEDGNKRYVCTPALDKKTIRKNYIARNKTINKYIPLSFNLHVDSSIAYIGIKSFSIGNLKHHKFKYKNFVDEAFLQIKNKNIQNLIIDVRSNPGGEESYSKYLYSYIADSSFNYFKSLPIKTNKKPSFWKHTNKPFIFRLVKLFYINQTDTGFYVVRKSLFKIYNPAKNKFEGNVFILVDGFTGSAAALFAAFAQSNNRAVIIGEETKGAYMGENSGDGITLILPNSKIEILIPFVKVNMNVKPKEHGRGVIPDYSIVRKKESILNNKDETYEKAIDLILKL